MSVLRRWRVAEGGAAAVEGAIVLFGFVFLVFTLMEFLYVLFAYNSVVRGAQNAARYAMVNSSNGCAWLQANVNDSTAQVGVIPVSISVGASDCGASGTPTTCVVNGAVAQGTVRINAEYDFQSFFLSYLASTLPIRATVCVPMIN